MYASRTTSGLQRPKHDLPLFGSSNVNNGKKKPSKKSNKQHTAEVSKALLERLGLSTQTNAALLPSSELASIERLLHPRHSSNMAAEAVKDVCNGRDIPPVEVKESEEDKEERLAVLRHAKTKLDEERDEVKHMNQLMLYAQCVTIRDAQLAEKREREEAQKLHDRLLDDQMELERQALLKAEHEAAEAKERRRRLGAATIIDQIKARELERFKAEEIRETEATALLENSKKIAELEEVKRLERAEQGRLLMTEVAAANKEAMKQKVLKKEKEAQEECARLAYIQAKESRERAAEEEATRLRNEKEKEVARLRTLQEKAQDTRSSQDEVRARRYQQEKDRAHRESALAKERLRINNIKEIKSIRQAQIAEKEEKQQMELQMSKDEMQRIEKIQLRDEKRERDLYDQRQLERKQHANDLVKLIELSQNAKASERAARLAESALQAQKTVQDRERLEQIRLQKVAALEKMKVPLKYAAALQCKDFSS